MRYSKRLIAALVALVALLSIAITPAASAATASTYTTGNSCTYNGIAFVTSITWERSGNYVRPTAASWRSVSSVWNWETDWMQNSYTAYVTEQYYDQRPTFSGSLTYPGVRWLYVGSGYSDYVLSRFSGPYGGSAPLCTVKTTS